MSFSFASQINHLAKSPAVNKKGRGQGKVERGKLQQVRIAYQLSPPGLENAHPGEYRRERAQSRHEQATATESKEASTSVSTSRLDRRSQSYN